MPDQLLALIEYFRIVENMKGQSCEPGGIPLKGLQIACVVKIYFDFKSEEHDDRSNYRPISVLPVVSRLFEKLIYDQLYNHIDKNKYLYMHQSSFRALHSVVTCLLKSINNWYVNIDNSKVNAVIFIDLKKAFDTVDHDILLAKKCIIMASMSSSKIGFVLI